MTDMYVPIFTGYTLDLPPGLQNRHCSCA